MALLKRGCAIFGGKTVPLPFLFGTACVISVITLVWAVRYGTTAAAEQIIENGEGDREATELLLEEIKAKRTMQSFGEIELLERLQEYEATLSTRSIGTASVDTISAAHERFIGADLTGMKLYLYENGYAVATFDIKSKGKRGSRWETPTGLYKIETKEKDHFSSIGEVHMPYSMQFFGNFFIHGWPYYPSGEPVPEGFSGGCIRLSTEDAEKVYAFASRSMPIFVWEENSDTEVRFKIDAQQPKIDAKSYLVADLRTGDVFAEVGAEKQRPIASITKLLNALVANETIHYDRTLTVTGEDREDTGSTPGQILRDETFTVGELLYPLLMESNNSVANALSRYHGTGTFMKWVNDKARAVGMEKTHMEDPSGLSSKNVSTASDLFKLMRYIHNSQSFILNITRTKSKTITAESGRAYTLSNFNHFAGTKEFRGGKTGHTEEALQTMATIFEVQVGEEKATIAIIVLGTSDRKKDVEKLLSWFKENATLAE